jgi:hypothetical protein
MKNAGVVADGIPGIWLNHFVLKRDGRGPKRHGPPFPGEVPEGEKQKNCFAAQTSDGRTASKYVITILLRTVVETETIRRHYSYSRTAK